MNVFQCVCVCEYRVFMHTVSLNIHSRKYAQMHYSKGTLKISDEFILLKLLQNLNGHLLKISEFFTPYSLYYFSLRRVFIITFCILSFREHSAFIS